ncbi:MAG TPA: hypothetical protein VIX84_17210 [Acidimicrobiales bacterium]
MRRTPTAILAAATVTVGLLGLVLAPDVAGARLASTAKGTTMCFVSGTITASPALTLGSGKATTLTFSARLQGCTGTNASNIMHATLTGKSTDTSASCVAFENAFPMLSAKVSYKTISGSMAQTKLAFSAGTLNYTAMPLSISYPKHGGKGVATGSFATKHASLMLNLSVPYTEWVSTCQSPTGLASMTIVSTSSATL